MILMPPGEHLDGTTAECAHLHLLLACFRASPPPMRLPEVTGRPLLSFSGTCGAGVGIPVLATGVFQHVNLSWTAAGRTGTQVGSPSKDDVLPGTFSQSAGTLTVSGSGDIGPASPDGGTSLWNALQFTFLGLLVLVAVGALFGAAEYGPELTRVPLTGGLSPAPQQVPPGRW